MQNQPNYVVAEVVWAKIRGYPWWPAIVSQVQDDDLDDIQFKVNFFGDTTHSFLDESKMVKFQEGYTQYEAEGRANKKLAKSILEAETHLKDKAIHLNLIKKPPKVKLSISRKQSTISKISNSFVEINQSETEKQVIVSKHSVIKRTETIVEVEEEPSAKKKPQPQLKTRAGRNNSVVKQKSQSQSEQQSQQKQMLVQPKPVKEKAVQKVTQKIKIKNVTNIRQDQEMKSTAGNQKNTENQSSNCPILLQKLRLRVTEKQSNDKIERKERIKDLLQQVKKYASEPQQIIDYLNSLDITTENIKEILDCDIVEILQNTPGETSNNLLTKMRQTLLNRYFTDDEEDKAKTSNKSKSKNLFKRAKQRKLRMREQNIQNFQELLKEEFYNLRAENANDEAQKLQKQIYEKDNSCGDQYQEHVSVLIDQLQLKKYSIRELHDFINVLASIKETI